MEVPGVADLLNFTGKVVVVTGADRGIGRGIALRFAEAGATVGVHYHRHRQGAEETGRRIEALGAQAHLLQADVADYSEVGMLVETARQKLGKINVLVHNAGIQTLTLLREMQESEWEKMLRTDLSSAFYLTRAVAELMIEQGEGGAIINIASIEGENPAVNHTHYAAAKGGLIMYTRAAALELGQYNIRVNAVSPGLIWKEGLDEAWPEGVRRYTSTAPLSRLGKPEDIGDSCLFLASPAARWITGVNLRVDGGMIASTGY
jgi:3-oxoacyl-[acyl-carrier protein] reductase